MSKKAMKVKVREKEKPAQPVAGAACCSCRFESLVGVDEKGQMVLPKAVRDRARIKAGDKLGLVTWEKNGEICCMALIKASEIADMAKNMLGPLMKDM